MEKQVAPSLFRTYGLSKYTSTTTENAKILEAARATTAAPPFFGSIEIGALGSTFADGNEDDGEVSDKMEKCAIQVAEKALAAESISSDDALVARFDQLRGTLRPTVDVFDVDSIPTTETGGRCS